jgi:DNA repair exonuclease SbcCD ATPase subunit
MVSPGPGGPVLAEYALFPRVKGRGMQQLDKRIVTLRLRLAEIRAREDQQKALRHQFRGQMEKVVDFAARENSDLDAALSMLDEIDTRYDQVERTLRHLQAIKAKAQEELDALVLTRSIEAAKQELAGLEEEKQRLEAEIHQMGSAALHSVPIARGERLTESQLRERLSDVETEIRYLRQKISDASEEAARTVSSRLRQAG